MDWTVRQPWLHTQENEPTHAQQSARRHKVWLGTGVRPTSETRRACSNIHYISEHNDDILQAEAVKITERPGVFLVEYHAGP